MPLKGVQGNWQKINEIVLVSKNVSADEKREIQKNYAKNSSIILYASKEGGSFELKDISVIQSENEIKQEGLRAVHEVLSNCP